MDAQRPLRPQTISNYCRPPDLAGALLCLLALVTWFVVPEQSSLGNYPMTAWWVVIGFGAAFILWAVGFTLWRQGRSLLA